jgi:hypothetical protein
MEQRPQARQDALNRVRSALTQLVSPFVAKNLNVHAGLQRKISGQLRNLGSCTALALEAVNVLGGEFLRA